MFACEQQMSFVQTLHIAPAASRGTKKHDPSGPCLSVLFPVAAQNLLKFKPVPGQIQHHIPGTFFQEAVAGAGDDHQLGLLVDPAEIIHMILGKQDWSDLWPYCNQTSVFQMGELFGRWEFEFQLSAGNNAARNYG